MFTLRAPLPSSLPLSGPWPDASSWARFPSRRGPCQNPPTAGSPQLTGPPRTHPRAQIPALNPLSAQQPCSASSRQLTEIAPSGQAPIIVAATAQARKAFETKQDASAADFTKVSVDALRRHRGRQFTWGRLIDRVCREVQLYELWLFAGFLHGLQDGDEIELLEADQDVALATARIRAIEPARARLHVDTGPLVGRRPAPLC